MDGILKKIPSIIGIEINKYFIPVNGLYFMSYFGEISMPKIKFLLFNFEFGVQVEFKVDCTVITVMKWALNLNIVD